MFSARRSGGDYTKDGDCFPWVEPNPDDTLGDRVCWVDMRVHHRAPTVILLDGDHRR